ncbi:MAG: leucyl/phenylalanyl-tRNA--protein transferase [Halomonadaceae bacterium]|nr:MAG: leucyl/phenylalanyl-tRNA--protein transferase [Halomonadaceae bacterium]
MTALPWLNAKELWFPQPDTALSDPDGLLAVGSDLSPERLQLAYRMGIFPWFAEDQPILWWSPDPRCVLIPGQEHISRSLRRRLNQNSFQLTMNQAFKDVIHLCGATRSEGTWITRDMAAAYGRLHDMGLAHSCEAWNSDGKLVGGLYGVALGRCFFGESMFSRETDASKVVFVHLSRQLAQWGYQLFDCQVDNPHLRTLGASLISRQRFLAILKENVQATAPQADWQLTWRWPHGAPS